MVTAVLLVAGAAPALALVDNHDDDLHHGQHRLHAHAAVTPGQRQLAAAAELDATVRWTEFGTVQSIIAYGAFLAEGVEGDDASSAALSWIGDNLVLFGLQSLDSLELHADIALTGDAHVVVLRQRIGGELVSPDGKASVGLVGSPASGWNVAYVSSRLVPDDEPTALSLPERLTLHEAFVEATRDVGVELRAVDVRADRSRGGWRVLEVAGLEADQLLRRVSFPIPGVGVRPAYETDYFDGHDEGYRHIIDAETGEVLYRESIVDHSEEPAWEVYPATPRLTPMGSPPWNYPNADTRDLWCWTFVPGCKLLLENDAARVPWDVDAVSGDPTFTTIGNAVRVHRAWDGEQDDGYRLHQPDRRYHFPFTNAWHETGCHPDNLTGQGNDIDASMTSLFAANWRMHTWAYHLGFTEETWNGQAHNFGLGGEEGDPVIARAQAGALTGARNNATMATRPDGTPSTMSMFLWQPTAGGFYGPCAVGDLDMSLVGHEYTHMIENRLIGKGDRRDRFHAGAMGESWADFVALEYLNQYGLLPSGGDNRWAVAPYVTGNADRGLRNFRMSYPSAGAFPQAGRPLRVGGLHFGSIGYDILGSQVHADSEIWSATNHDLRSLFLARYPSPGADAQRACADGLRAVEDCPGNRRWIQLVFDAMLLMPTAPTMLDARDAYFAADLMRFGGANQDLLWLGFARRGFGVDAAVRDPEEGIPAEDRNPVPNFESLLHEGATLTFEAVAKDEGGQPVAFEVYAGHYEARTTPLQAVETFVPNPEGYDFVARADGYGHVRFHVRDLAPGEARTVRIHFPTNVASQAQGATATGDGVDHAGLIDDTEATVWERAPRQPNVVVVDPPSAAAGEYEAAGAAFGPPPTGDGVSGDIVAADPILACEPLIDFPAGAIALVDRGTCDFTEKVAHAQVAGASAVIVVNNSPVTPSTMSGTDDSIMIPSVLVRDTDGDAIKAGLPATGTVARAAPSAGSQVTIALDGERTFSLAKASAMLRAGVAPAQSRFSALRRFELYACTAGNAANPGCDGDTDAGWERFLRSRSDAFPGVNPRPAVPDLVLRSFQIPQTTATHVKFVAVDNQCTGYAGFQGEQDNDPTASTDCRSTLEGRNHVRAAELQLLTSRPVVDGAAAVD